jgi:hypothetical protein
VLHIGCGSSCAACRLDEAVRLAESGVVSYLAFDRLAERTTAHLQLEKWKGGSLIDPEFETYMEQLLPLATQNDIKLISNAGGDDPESAVEAALRVARRLRLDDIKVASVRTHDPLPIVRDFDPVVVETGEPLSHLDGEVIGASVYFGAGQIVEGLDLGADLVITGRVGDSTLYLGPMIHEFGWSWDDWDTLASGMGLGHMMECGGQVTGGYFASPPYKVVPGLARLGLPYAEVDASGTGIITKLPETGGLVNVPICKEQMLYEVGNPAQYIHPDVIVDFTTTTLVQEGPDRVRVSGTSGHPRPETLKVLVVVLEGYLGECFVQFGGSDAMSRAQLAVEVMNDRMRLRDVKPREFRVAYLGVDSLFSPWGDSPDFTPREISVHLAGRFDTREQAEWFADDCTVAASNHYGPAAGTCGRRVLPVEEIANTYTVLIPRDALPAPDVFIKAPTSVREKVRL